MRTFDQGLERGDMPPETLSKLLAVAVCKLKIPPRSQEVERSSIPTQLDHYLPASKSPELQGALIHHK